MNMSWLILHATTLSLLLALSHGILRWIAEQRSASYWTMLVEHRIWFTLALAIYGFVFLYYTNVLRTGRIALLYPTYTGLSVILVFLVGVFYFDESVSVAQGVGCLLIVLGVVLVARA